MLILYRSTRRSVWWPHVLLRSAPIHPCRLGRIALVGALYASGSIAAAHAQSRGAAANSIELDEIRVQGNSVLAATEIEEAVYPFLGPGKTATDVEHAREALVLLYQRHGYQTVAVVIPPQHVTDGIVYIKVVEQKVERLRVVGAHFVEPDVLRRQAPSLQKGKIPNLNDLKRDVTRLNMLADRSVTPSIRPGRAPNTVDADLNVQDALPLHGTLELNNRRSVDTSALRLNGSLTYDNFWQRGDTGSLFFQVAPTNTADARVVGGSYLFHIPATEMALLVSYTNSDSTVNTIGNLNVVGKGQIINVQLQIPLSIENGFIQTLTAGASYKKLDENVSIGEGTSPQSRYPITYYPASIGYEGDWVSLRAQTSLNADITFGLRGAGSTPTAFDNKRKYANENFSYARISLTRTQFLPHDFQLYGNANAQATTDALLSTEQFSLGGIDTVRGYLESETLGDDALALQLEARSPSIARYVGSYVNSWRFHVFGDVGNVSVHRGLPQQRTSDTLASVGVGTRVSLFGYLNASVEDAFLLTDGPNSRSGSNRVLFRLYGSF